MARNRGAQELAKHCGDATALAARLEVSQATISLWRSGNRVPAEPRRLQLEQPPPVGCGIPRAWWDEAPVVAPRPPAPPREPSRQIATLSDVQEATIELARTFIKAAEQLLEDSHAPDLEPIQRARIVASAAPTIQALSKLAGSMLELSPEQIVRAPAFALVREKIVAALAAFPEARDAVIAALEGAPTAPTAEEKECDI